MTWELGLGIFGAISLLAAGAWALIKAFGYLVGRIVSQFNQQLDERFVTHEKLEAGRMATWEGSIARLDQKHERIDRELRELLIAMPDKYVRREDYVRRETVIEAKIDQLGLRIQNWILENKHGT
jgi:hypothetical protein